jgi:spore coat polysaccharide biosynthesis protein SpsF
MKPRNVAIIQARMGSSRFPGKMLARLGGVPLLEWGVRRLLRATTLAQVVLATSEGANDDKLAELAAGLGVAVFRGNEADVLGRFLGAASMTGADNVVRVCADNPFVDPSEIDRLVTFFAASPCDYACNHLDRLGSGYADGFGAEILSVGLLHRLANLAKDVRYREHLTLYLWEHQSQFRLKAIDAPLDLRFPGLRFDIDHPCDLSRLESLVVSGVGIETPAASIVEIALAELAAVSSVKDWN